MPVSARYVLLAFFVQGRYSFTVSARYQNGTGPIQDRYNVDCIGPVQYSLYGIGPVPNLYRVDTMSVMAQYWPATVYTIPARYHFSIGPIQGRYNYDCNGPVLALYSLYGIGPVPIQYRANTGPIRKRKNLENTKII